MRKNHHHLHKERLIQKTIEKVIIYYSESWKIKPLESELRDAGQFQFPTLILCLDSAHSAEKLGLRYPFVNDSVLEVLYGFRKEPGTVRYLIISFYVFNIRIFNATLCQAKSHIGPSDTLIQPIFQFQNRQSFIKLLTKLIWLNSMYKRNQRIIFKNEFIKRIEKDW